MAAFSKVKGDEFTRFYRSLLNCVKKKKVFRSFLRKEIKQNFIKPLGQKIFPLSAFYASLLLFIDFCFTFFSLFFQNVFDRAVRCGIVREGVVVSTA